MNQQPYHWCFIFSQAHSGGLDGSSYSDHSCLVSYTSMRWLSFTREMMLLLTPSLSYAWYRWEIHGRFASPQLSLLIVLSQNLLIFIPCRFKEDVSEMCFNPGACNLYQRSHLHLFLGNTYSSVSSWNLIAKSFQLSQQDSWYSDRIRVWCVSIPCIVTSRWTLPQISWYLVLLSKIQKEL